MSSRFDLIAQQVFQKEFEHCTIDELQQFAAAHPYMASAHFLLAKKLHEEQDSEYASVAQKAALYYHQPMAFSAFLLAPEPFTIETEEEIPGQVVNEKIAPSEVVLPAPETGEEQIAAAIIAEPEVHAEEEERPLPPLPVLPRLDAPVKDTGLAFEPFHTVDYFASMGIKLSQDDLPKDKFGKQLMTFTAWLKTMKKLPASEHAKNMDPQAEAKVESMAAHSVDSPEVVTETMAEIWIKQGQPAKAADVYRKLSLLHPSKKAYFASKLEHLKQ